MVVPRTIHPFPRCHKPARESRLSKLAYYCQCVVRRRRRKRLIYIYLSNLRLLSCECCLRWELIFQSVFPSKSSSSTMQSTFNLVSHYLFHHIINFPPRHLSIGDLQFRSLLRVKVKHHENVNYRAIK